jgi:di/tricarboxylate transporter
VTNRLLKGLGIAVQHHQLIRRLLLLWAVIIITLVTYIVFTDPPNVPSGTATAYGIVVGLLATVIGLYKWSRDRDAQRKLQEKDDGVG